MPYSEWRLPEGPPVTEDRIEELERKLGVKFPEELLQIVRIGDALQPASWTIVKKSLGENIVIGSLIKILSFEDKSIKSNQEVMICNREDVILDKLMEEGKIDDNRSLLSQAKELAGDFRWIIPIGENGDGWICLDYRDDPERAKCQVVSYDQSTNDDLDADGLVFIADSFQSLLSMLRS